MSIRTIIYKNIIERQGKTILILLGLSLAIAALVSVVAINRSIERAVGRQLDDYGFNIIITPKKQGFELEYGGLTLGSVDSGAADTLSAADLKTVREISRETGGIRGLSPKLLKRDSIGNTDVVLAGTDLRQERQIKDWWLIEAGRYPETADELFIGQSIADLLGLRPGDVVELHEEQFTVAGILMKTGSQDDTIIFIDLDRLRQLSGGEGKLHLIEIAAKTTADVGPVAKRLAEALPNATVQSVQEAVRLQEHTFDYLLRFGLGVNIGILTITALIIFTMTASAVNERRAEIGVLRAVGFRRSVIFRIILGEAAALGVVGGLFGLGLAILSLSALPLVLDSTWAASLVSAGMTVETELVQDFQPVFDATLLPLAVITAVIVSVGAGVVPARRAADLDPVEALKSL